MEVDAHAERSTRVHWFGYGVRLPSPQGLASGGSSRGGEASVASQPATGGRSMRHDRRCFGRLGQEDQRLKKHYGRWMDIVDHAVPRPPRLWMTARPRKGMTWSRGRRGVDALAERSTRVDWFGCGVRLPSPQNNMGCG